MNTHWTDCSESTGSKFPTSFQKARTCLPRRWRKGKYSRQECDIFMSPKWVDIGLEMNGNSLLLGLWMFQLSGLTATELLLWISAFQPWCFATVNGPTAMGPTWHCLPCLNQLEVE